MSLLQRHWLLLALIGLVAGSVAYGASYLISPVYSSSTRVLVHAREARFLTSSGQDLSSRAAAVDLLQPKSLGQTLSGLATSRPVAESVVRELGLDQPRPRDQSLIAQLRSGVRQLYTNVVAYARYGYVAEPPSAFEGAVAGVHSSVEAVPVKDSYLIEIRSRADDPRLAAAIADAAAAAFVEVTRTSFHASSSAYRDFLADEVEQARLEVEEAEEAVRRYKAEHGIVDVSEQLRLQAGGTETLRQQLRDTEADLEAARARAGSLESALSGLTPLEATSVSATGRARTATAQELETGRALSTTANETTTESSESRDTQQPNRVYQDLQRGALTARSEVAALEARRTTLNVALQGEPATAVALSDHAATLGQLELERSAVQAKFGSVRGSFEAAAINSAQAVEEVRQIESASTPLYPDRPFRPIFALLGLFLGVAGGIGLLYGMQVLRPRWWAGYELSPPRVAAPALPVQAGIPDRAQSSPRPSSD